ncbi:MAG: SAM-dependent chlorinase/fluorinase [Actinobacteria bacterium]|nr:MAG: SAM-dependent chlorinase/fluorinase [Actinomycetota bacterium]
MGRPLVSFLSDYGHEDEFVGVCHGVIARRCPDARIIDITHAIPRGDVRLGALVLADALPYMPCGVHLAVVDPGVGALDGRAAVAVRTAERERMLVGPDNGLLMIAAERLGGALEAVEISHSPERLQPVSRTFHGRDIFAPVAAALAAGAPLAEVGAPIDTAELRRLQLPGANVGEDALTAHVLRADRFGNLTLDASGAELESALGTDQRDLVIEVAGKVFAARRAGTFSDVDAGELVVYEDGNRMAAIAVNQGSAAESLGIAPEQQLRVRAA